MTAPGDRDDDTDLGDEVVDDVQDLVDPPGGDIADDRPVGADMAADSDPEDPDPRT